MAAALLFICYLVALNRDGQRVSGIREASARLAMLSRYSSSFFFRRATALLVFYVKRVGCIPKLKVLFSFYGIATSLDVVYDAQMPPAYKQLVHDTFSWVQISWVSSQPPHNRSAHLSGLATHPALTPP